MQQKENKQWYVLRAVFRHEGVVRDALRKSGFRCYVPMTWRVDTASNIHQCQVVCHKLFLISSGMVRVEILEFETQKAQTISIVSGR